MKPFGLFLLTVYGKHRNRSIFNNAWIPPDITISLLMNKIKEHNLNTVISKKRITRVPVINNETPWAYFDGASQGEPLLGGAGAVIYFFSKRKMMVKYATSQATNNMAELAALWATLKVAHNNQIQDIQIFGDSKVVVDWEMEETIYEFHIYNIYLLKFRI